MTSMATNSSYEQYRVTLVDPDGNSISFLCGSNEAIFSAAQKAGYELTLGCMQGRCTVCKAKLISGDVKFLRPIPKGNEDKLSGAPNELLCSVAPQSDSQLQTFARWYPTNR